MTYFDGMIKYWQLLTEKKIVINLKKKWRVLQDFQRFSLRLDFVCMQGEFVLNKLVSTKPYTKLCSSMAKDKT